jgi:indole-3-glycerol phosphate synthase
MILDEIVADKSAELEATKRTMPFEKLVAMASERSKPVDVDSALRGPGVKIIAEIKKASPSKGIIRTQFNPFEIANIYADYGASAISVLTESKRFQGNLTYLSGIKDALRNRNIPLLRKDFIFDSYQVYESRAYGADFLLLIVAILSYEKLRELMELSHRLNMECLVEVHNETEMKIALDSNAGIIGINNRDLGDFTVDLSTTQRLSRLIPRGKLVVSESGIKTREDIQKMKEWGIDAVLIGESFMAAHDIASKLKELI